LIVQVDASLDAQHAARAGRLMQNRAKKENVTYIAISRESNKSQAHTHTVIRFGFLSSCFTSPLLFRFLLFRSTAALFAR
jgi:hypothetical protein